MSPAIIALLISAVIIIALLIWLIVKSSRPAELSATDKIQGAFQTLTAELVTKQMDGLLKIRESQDQANRILNERLSESSRSLDQKVAVFGEIKNKIGELAVQAKNMETIGQNIQSLSDLLKPPKLRGSVGETFLENILTQILPKPLFEIQHTFPSGVRVDAIIRVGSKALPIDSKFPLEAFNKHIEHPDNNDFRKQFSQSIKKHVDDICGRYILPQDGTLEFAVMYIPAESIYYQFVANEGEGFDYALSKRVIPSSPGHLYGFLATLSAVYAETGLATQGRQLGAFLKNIADSLTKLSGIHERMDGSVRALTASLGKARDETRTAEQHLLRLKKPDGEEPELLEEFDFTTEKRPPLN